MAFELRKMSLEDEDFVYSDKNRALISKFASVRKSDILLTTSKWTVDEERGYYFLRLNKGEVMSSDVRFLLLFGTEVVIVETLDEWNMDIKLKLLYASEAAKARLPEIEEVIRQAVAVGGDNFFIFLGGVFSSLRLSA